MATLPQDGAMLAEYQRYIMLMCQERGFSEQSIEQKFVKLLEELGELAQAAAGKAGLSVSRDRTDKISGEVADVFIVFVDLCNKLEVDIETAVLAKEAKNKTRSWK